MKKYRQFVNQYGRCVVFVPDGKEYAVIRRLYGDGNGLYRFRYNNHIIRVTEDQLYW